MAWEQQFWKQQQHASYKETQDQKKDTETKLIYRRKLQTAPDLSAGTYPKCLLDVPDSGL
jgi:hypothetical protein